MTTHQPFKPMPDELRDKDILDFKTNIERKVWLNRKALGRKLHGLSVEQKCILIPGMQRSGSKLLMQLFEWSKYTDCYPEDDKRAFDYFQMRNTDKIRELRKKSSAEFFVIKSLCELDQTYILLDKFTPAKATWILRDFRDCVNSCIWNFSGFACGRTTSPKTVNMAGWRGRGMSDETWEVIQRFERPELNEADTGAALQWYYRKIFFFEQNLDRDEKSDDRALRGPGHRSEQGDVGSFRVYRHSRHVTLDHTKGPLTLFAQECVSAN